MAGVCLWHVRGLAVVPPPAGVQFVVGHRTFVSQQEFMANVFDRLSGIGALSPVAGEIKKQEIPGPAPKLSGLSDSKAPLERWVRRRR